MTDAQAFTSLLEPLVEILKGIRLGDPEAARAALEQSAPVDGALVAGIRDAAVAGAEAGWLLPKEMGGIRFGRVEKDLGGFSVDAVLSSGAGPKHRHPAGEIDLLLPLDGAPSFDGHSPGWAVYPPGSEHVPGVSGGTMLILYFLPGGAIDWL